jgi:phosphotransferase system enzyme I (PtsI)
MIVMVRRAAPARGFPVSLCGEMASDPALLTLLVGLGLTEFSMTPGAIPVAKQVLAELRSDELRAMARRILRSRPWTKSNASCCARSARRRNRLHGE